MKAKWDWRCCDSRDGTPAAIFFILAHTLEQFVAIGRTMRRTDTMKKHIKPQLVIMGHACITEKQCGHFARNGSLAPALLISQFLSRGLLYQPARHSQVARPYTVDGSLDLDSEQFAVQLFQPSHQYGYVITV